jgi:hypothetical protein
MHGIWNISNIISHFLLVFLCKIFNVEKDKRCKTLVFNFTIFLGCNNENKINKDIEKL